jgi:hypothetical protein
MIRSAKQLFEEELSGEPLTQESVIEAMNMFAIEVLEECINYNKTPIENSCQDNVEDKIKELKQNLNEKV